MPFWIDTSSKLKLAIVPRPRGGDWLEDEIRSLKRDGIDILVSLLTDDETRELGLIDEEAACISSGVQFRRFQIADRGVPDSAQQFMAFVSSLLNEARSGCAIGAHCRACIGRSSVLLASIMSIEGYAVADAFARISKSRGLQVPDTPEQREWVTRTYVR